MTMTKKLTIIVVSFNTNKLLLECIKSVYSTINKTDFEIIVVDNASSDGSVEMVRSTFPHVKIIANATNTGFSAANNQAVRVSTGKYVLLLNSDTLLNDGAIDTLVDFMNDHPEAAAVGPKVLNFDGSLQSKGFYFPSVLWTFVTLFRVNKVLTEHKMRKLFPRFCWGEDDIKQVDWVSGCCFLMSKKAIDKIGMLSEEFFMYSEEVEWCYRAYKYDFKVWYLPIAQIFHLNEASPFKNRSVVFNKSKILFCKKTIGIYTSVLISILSIISHMVNYIRVSIKPRNNNEKINCISNIKQEIKWLKLILASKNG